jgi:hypothetical protein
MDPCTATCVVAVALSLAKASSLLPHRPRYDDLAEERARHHNRSEPPKEQHHEGTQEADDPKPDINHHFDPAESSGNSHRISTSYSHSMRLFAPTTTPAPFALSRVALPPPSLVIRDDQLYLSTTGVLFQPLEMAFKYADGDLRRHVNESGHVFYVPTVSPTETPDDPPPSPSISSHDTEEHRNGDNLEGDLHGLAAKLNLGNADASVPPGCSTRIPPQPARGAASNNSFSQWDVDNMPIQATPLQVIQDPGHDMPTQDAPISYEVSLDEAFGALELPVSNDNDGVAKLFVVQAALQFVFRNEGYRHNMLHNMPDLGDVYDERVPALASDFYHEYGLAIWGPGAGKAAELDSQRLTALQKFFALVSQQDATREETGDDPEGAVQHLSRLRRDTVPTAHDETSAVNPNASLAELYSALEIQISDTWVERLFRNAVAQMTFDALRRVYDSVYSFPRSRPSRVLINATVTRITNRYTSKLWPNSIAIPQDAAAILHHYIVALLKTPLNSEELGSNALQILDGLLELDDGDAEEASHRERVSPDEDAAGGFACTLSHLAEYASCLEFFATGSDLIDHLVGLHEMDQETADDIVRDVRRTS